MTDRKSPKPGAGPAPLSPQDVRRLTASMCDEDPTPAQFASLERALVESEDARRAYLSVRQTHSTLITRVTEVGCTAPASHDPSGDELAAKRRDSGNRLMSRWGGPLGAWALGGLAIAATLLLVVAPSLLATLQGERRLAEGSAQGPQQAADALAAAPPPAVEPVADITMVSDDCRLLVEGSQVDTEELAQLLPDEEVCLITGAVHVRFLSGVQSAVLAPAVFTPRSPWLIEMAEGRLTADVGENGAGFTVETVDAEIVDLGTVFGVSVSSVEGTEVVVFDGEVEVNAPKKAAPKQFRFASQRVERGEGVEIGVRDEPSPLMSFTCADYVLPQELLVQPIHRTGSVIASVADNLDRGTQATYSYEIVNGGMREDAVAFADRGYHQWNGVTEAGIPEYLRGADFVRGFSNLKYASDYEMYVTLGQPANLYVFVDDRVETPDWVTQDFVPTGDKIGLDEGPHVDERHRPLPRSFPGLGPGSSIDQTFTVWKRVVSEPSTVTCGHNSELRGHIQMYGIAATPLAPDHAIKAVRRPTSGKLLQ